jgi:hypothetical protein
LQYIDPTASRRTLKATTAAGTLTASAVGGDGGVVLNAADLETSAGEGAEGRDTTGAESAATDTTSSPDADVDGVDATLLQLLSNILSSEHSGVGRGLLTVSLDAHTTGNAAEGLTARKVGDVNEGVVEGGVDASHTEGELLTLVGDGLVVENLLLLHDLLLGGLKEVRACCKANVA